jgi:hypothetical protein
MSPSEGSHDTAQTSGNVCVSGVHFDTSIQLCRILRDGLSRLGAFTVMTAASSPGLRIETLLDGRHPVVFPITNKQRV